MKRLNGIKFRAGVEQAAQKIAAALGLTCTLEWIGGTSTAAINSSGTIMLSNVPDDAVVNQALVDKYAGFVVHELLHRKFTDFSVSGYGDYLRALHNACEDAWIERTAIASNLTGNVEGLLTTLVNSMVDEAMREVQDWSDPAQYPFALAVWGRGFCKRVPLASGLEFIFSDAFTQIGKCTSSADTLAVAEWVMSQLKALPKKHKRQEQQSGEQSGEQGQEAGQATAPSDKTQARNVEPTIDGEALGGTYSTGDISPEGHHAYRKTPLDLTASVPARLRFEVRKLFENSANEEFQINRRAGGLNVRALHKVHTSDALFKRRLESSGIDSAVVIMLDVSGSMFVERKKRNAAGHIIVDAGGQYVRHYFMQQAVKTAAALMDTLNRAQVSTAIVTFGSTVSVLKPFDMPARKAAQRLALVGTGGTTNDYTALRFSHQILHGRPEQRKVVFVITDGIGDSVRTRAQVDAGQNLGITTVGIGIDEDVKHIYPQSVMVTDGIGDASFKQIKLAA